jgi:Protein of unknown function (DUF3433)
VQIGRVRTKADYFNASYLGTLLAVILKNVWTIVFASTKIMEPFYYLSRPDGASAKESLVADYLSSSLSLTSLRGMFNGHWVMLLTTLIYFQIGLLAPLATESMTVKALSLCETPDNGQQPCNAVWVADIAAARGLEAFLILTAAMIFALIVIKWHRHRRDQTGLFSNPSSLATMASLLGEPSVLTDLRRIKPDATRDDISAALSCNRYKLEGYVSPTGQRRHGITSSANPRQRQSTLKKGLATLSNLGNSLTPRVGKNTRDALFLTCIFALFAIIVAYYFDFGNDPFNLFFNSDTFGPRFVLTSAATLIDNNWKRLEREIRIMEPYRRLYKRDAKAQDTILATVDGTPLSGLPRAIWRRNWFHAFIAFIAIMSDVLIVAIAGVPFSHAQIYQAYLASVFISMGILGLMIVATGGVFWWRRENGKMGMQREPDTLAAVWLMLCGEKNGVVEEFGGWEKERQRKRDEVCRERGRKYWAGFDGEQVERREGPRSERWVVDGDYELEMK